MVVGRGFSVVGCGFLVVGFWLLVVGIIVYLSVLVGLLVGYVLALFMGMIDFSGLSGLSIVALPKLLPFTPEFNIGAILSVVAVYLVSATETIGDTSALCNSALKRDPKTKEMGAAVCCDGFVSSVSGLFGCTPITSFSQNVGLAAIAGKIPPIIMMMAPMAIVKRFTTPDIAANPTF